MIPVCIYSHNPIYRFSQMLFNTFWKDVESRAMAGGVMNPFLLSKTLKELGRIYYGSIIAYDEALIEGDPMLAEALWRNIWGIGSERADAQVLNQTVRYVRRELKNLEALDSKIFMSGFVNWGTFPPSALNSNTSNTNSNNNNNEKRNKNNNTNTNTNDPVSGNKQSSSNQ